MAKRSQKPVPLFQVMGDEELQQLSWAMRLRRRSASLRVEPLFGVSSKARCRYRKKGKRMSGPKHDKTQRDEVDEAIRENIRLGWMKEVSPGRYSLTEAGIAHVKNLLRSDQP
jgi:hypothetical protein